MMQINCMKVTAYFSEYSQSCKTYRDFKDFYVLSNKYKMQKSLKARETKTDSLVYHSTSLLLIIFHA